MSDSEKMAPPVAPPPARWPRAVGLIGIILGVLIFIDKVDDLVILTWSEDQWQRLLGPEVAGLVVHSLPSPAWMGITGLIWMAAAVVLIIGSARLRRRQKSGVMLCQRWAWLAITMLAVELVTGFWWLRNHMDELQELAPGQWEGTAVLVTLIVILIMLAFPAFLIFWFSRPAVREDYQAWSG